MKKAWNAILRLGPARLRNRLLLSFVLLILIPYTILQIWNYTEIENLIKSKIGVQNQAQVDNLAQEFETMRTTLFLSALQMENNERVWRLLSSLLPDSKQNEEEVASIFNSILALFPKTGAYINLAFIDNTGNLYTSFPAHKLTVEPSQTVWEIHPYCRFGQSQCGFLRQGGKHLYGHLRWEEPPRREATVQHRVRELAPNEHSDV